MLPGTSSDVAILGVQKIESSRVPTRHMSHDGSDQSDNSEDDDDDDEDDDDDVDVHAAIVEGYVHY